MVKLDVVRPERADVGPAALSRRLQGIALVVPVVALLASVAAMTVEHRLGLLGMALILGWAQLVGL